MYFYELHENDDELYSDVTLAHDAEYDEDEFLELVQEARQQVLDAFEDDSLIEAVAGELARRHGFVHVERQLRVAVNVSAHEGETRVTPLDEVRARDGEAEDLDGVDGEMFRSLLIERDPEDRN